MTRNGTFRNLIAVTGDDLCAGDSFVTRDIFSIIPELRETYFLRYFEEPNAISVNGRIVKISKIVNLYICYYAFSMLVRYHPEKWKTFCEASDIAIIRKLLINCRREMLVEVIQLLSGKEYAFTTVMEEMDAELDTSEVYKLVKEEAWREYKRTGRNTLIF